MKTNKKLIISLGLFVFILSIILKIGIIVKADSDNTSTIVSNAQAPNITYISQVQNKGWLTNVSNGETSGTTGEALRLEGIKISLGTLPKGLSGNISYSANVQGSGWQKEVSDGALAGTTGKGLRLEGIRIRLVGEISKLYSVYYRTHVQGKGWTNYVKDNEISGAVGESLRVEAIQIKLCQKVTDQNVSTTQLTNEIDQSLTPTQRWINSISDEIGKQDWHILGGNQSVNDGLTLISTKELENNYFVTSKIQFSTNNKDVNLNNVIYNKAGQPQAVQVISGTIEKKQSKVLLNITDKTTGKEQQIDLTSGHSSAVSALPISFIALEGVVETGALSAAMAAAAPGILIIGGATVLIGGGYWLYNQAQTNQSYTSAVASRKEEAFEKMKLDFSSLEEALENKDSSRSSYYQERISTFQKIYQTSEITVPNISKINVSIPTITINIPKIDLTNIKENMNRLNDSMSRFSKTMAEYRSTMDELTNPKSKFNQDMAAMNKSLKQWVEEMKKLPIDSAKPTYTEAVYDTKTKTLHLVGSMPTASKIEIYMDWKKTHSFPTQANGKFDIKVPVSSKIVAVDAVQNSTKDTNYNSLNSIVGPYGLPNFTIENNGDILLNEFAEKLFKNPKRMQKASAKPLLNKVNYDIQTNILTISGHMPTSSRINLYSESEKIFSGNTKSNGDFDIHLAIKAGSYIKIDAIQDSTALIKYASYYCSTFLGWEESTFYLAGLNISKDGVLSSFDDIFKSVKNSGIKTYVKNPEQPKFSNVSYDSKLKELHLVGKSFTKSTLKFYEDVTTLGTTTHKLINTITTTDSGNFDAKIHIENEMLKVTTTPISTASTYYEERDINNLSDFLSFKITAGRIIVDEKTKQYVPSSIAGERLTLPPTISNVSFDKTKHIFSIKGKMSGSSTINAYSVPKSLSGTYPDSSKITCVETNSDGTFSFTFPINSQYISINPTQHSTQSDIYIPNLFSSLEFEINSDGELLATQGTNFYLKNTLPTIPLQQVTKPPHFSSITYNKELNLVSIAGNLDSKGILDIYLNKVKVKSTITNEKGEFNLELPVSVNIGEVANLSIGGTRLAQAHTTYTSSLSSLDQPMFTIDSSKGLQICGESTPLVDIKKLITPIPRIEPFSVGDGIIIEGTTVPYSEILIKNKGIEYKGQADDKGIFKIPLKEVTKEDAFEILVTAPNNGSISYSQSESIKVGPTPVYSEEEMGIKAEGTFSDSTKVESGHLTDDSVDQLSRLAEISGKTTVVTLGSFVPLKVGSDKAQSYDQTAFRAGNTFFSMGSKGWDAIVKKLNEAGIVEPDEVSDEMWRINQRFLDNQIRQGKSFEFTTDPKTLDERSFGKMEYDYLKEMKYNLDNTNGKWVMEK
ncbi:hypothetical protein LL046_05870 [Lactococcus lactis subsp. lactis]|uniref:hypothetical protein n=6 Tax=Lactococcus lactis TaxID=1358 RepID=UPI001F0E0D63|nr:hypothetical protein [Lactococcus lactis]UMU18313.1 Ig domain-containing protein [Lactococcus lactis subsp. lactis]